MMVPVMVNPSEQRKPIMENWVDICKNLTFLCLTIQYEDNEVHAQTWIIQWKWCNKEHVKLTSNIIYYNCNRRISYVAGNKTSKSCLPCSIPVKLKYIKLRNCKNNRWNKQKNEYKAIPPVMCKLYYYTFWKINKQI